MDQLVNKELELREKFPFFSERQFLRPNRPNLKGYGSDISNPFIKWIRFTQTSYKWVWHLVIYLKH